MLDTIRGGARSLGVKIIFGMIIIVFIFWGVGNINAPSGGALATVNGENVTINDFREQYQLMEEQKPLYTRGLSEEDAQIAFNRAVLDRAIGITLVRQAAERMGIVVTQRELEAFLGEFTVFQDANGKFNRQLYVEIMQGSEGAERERAFINSIRTAKLIRMIALSSDISSAEARLIADFSMEKRKAQYVLFSSEEYSKNAAVSEEDVATYYEANTASFQSPAMAEVTYVTFTPEALSSRYPVTDEEAREYYEKNTALFHLKDRFESRHIFIAAPKEDDTSEGAQEKIAQAKEVIEGIQKQLQEGGDFNQLASMFSQDPQSAVSGGLVGWLDMGQSGSPEYDAAAFALNPGETSGIVRSSMGFHIIRLEDKKSAETLPFEQVQEGIKAGSAKQKAEADFRNVQADVEEALALGTPFADIAAKYGLEVSNTGFVPQSDAEKALRLHSDSRQVFVETLGGFTEDTGPIPVPLNVTDGIALVHVKRVEPARTLPLDEVKVKIAESLKASKGSELAKAAAEAALPSFTGTEVPEAFKEQAKLSDSAMRAFTLIQPLGHSPELAEDLFTSTGSWLPKVYAVDGGFVIARCDSVEPVTDDGWEVFKAVFIPQLGKGREEEVINAFASSILHSAKVNRYYDRVDSIQIRQ